MFSTPRRNTNSQQSSKRILDECDLIEVVNQLQNKFHKANGKLLDIPLPQIVAVGGQGAGKSGVVQSLVKREFLPQGTGVVTRRPTIIQLNPSEEAYAVFLHKENEKIYDFEQVKQEIIDETLRDPGPSGFSSKPITVKIYVPNVLKLTLVDLPGIVKNVVGDQAEGSIEEIYNMILEFIKLPNSIILATTPANVDIATSDALEIAKRVDPERKRTIGVLTKLDLMDPGTNACDVLENKLLPLERGYVGVLNRSQQDLDNNRDITYALQREKNFFESHPEYSRMADRMGSPYLMKVLNEQLREHIRKTLPNVRKELSHRLNSLRRDLKNFESFMGSKQEDGTKGAHIYLLKMLQLFSHDLQINLFGHSERMKMDKLTGGSMIHVMLYTEIRKILALPTTLTEEQLIILITNQHGIRNNLSVPTLTLEAVCCEILKQYQEPLDAFVDDITSIMIETVNNSANSVRLHPVLKSVLIHFISEAVDRCAEETKDMLGKHLKAEKSYCNVYHWGFNATKLELGLPSTPVTIWNSSPSGSISDGSNSSSSADSVSEENASDHDVSEGNICRRLLQNVSVKSNSEKVMDIIKDYVELIQKQVGDVSIKYIVCFLINGVSDFIKTELTAHILSSKNFQVLIEECEQEFAQRNEIMEHCAELEDAIDVIHNF